MLIQVNTHGCGSCRCRGSRFFVGVDLCGLFEGSASPMSVGLISEALGHAKPRCSCHWGRRTSQLTNLATHPLVARSNRLIEILLMRMIPSKAYPRRLSSFWIRAGADANGLLSHYSAYLNCMNHSSSKAELIHHRKSLSVVIFTHTL